MNKTLVNSIEKLKPQYNQINGKKKSTEFARNRVNIEVDEVFRILLLK